MSFLCLAVDGSSFVNVIEIYGTPKLSCCKEAWNFPLSSCCQVWFSSYVMQSCGYLIQMFALTCIYCVYLWRFLKDICLFSNYWLYRTLEILKSINNRIFNYLHYCVIQELVQGFDQETAAVVMARYASLKMETDVCDKS